MCQNKVILLAGITRSHFQSVKADYKLHLWLSLTFALYKSPQKFIDLLQLNPLIGMLRGFKTSW